MKRKTEKKGSYFVSSSTTVDMAEQTAYKKQAIQKKIKTCILKYSITAKIKKDLFQFSYSLWN